MTSAARAQAHSQGRRYMRLQAPEQLSLSLLAGLGHGESHVARRGLRVGEEVHATRIGAAWRSMAVAISQCEV